MHEKCGIASVVDLEGKTDVVPIAVRIASGLQHRGELGAGIASVRDGIIKVHKGNGLVHEVLTSGILAELSAPSAIAHTRYATSGSRNEELAQPFVHNTEESKKTFGFGFNGNIANHEKIRKSITSQGMSLSRDVDTELIMHLLIESIKTGVQGDIHHALKTLENQLDGTFNIVLLSGEGEAFTYRNANGNRPLSYSIIADRFVVTASEDSAIAKVFPDAKTYDLQPGQMIQAKTGAWKIEKILEPNAARCFFEWVYFSHFLSTLDGIPVRKARYECGQHLAKKDSLAPKDGIVVPVPDSASIAAEGYANDKNLPLSNAIKKVKEGRTFIAGKEDRITKAMTKYRIDPTSIAGRKIVVVDDSMVRGTTLKILIHRLRNEGKASEIHLRIASPPILAPCYYGIDFSTTEELIARQHYTSVLQSDVLPDDVLARIADELSLDSIQFLSQESVLQVLEKYRDELCMACVNGNYPTATGQRLYNIASMKN